MKSPLILALDQGTTSSRALLFNQALHLVASAQQEFPQLYPQPGWVEHDPETLWQSQRTVITDVLNRAGCEPADVAALALANQRETVVVWNRHTGRPVYNAIVWQCRRTAAFCEELKRNRADTVIREKTGLVPDAYFSVSKIRWILDHVDGARAAALRGDLLCGTVDSWLLWKLTGGATHATDFTNASRTLLFNIHALRWDEELLALFDIPASMLPNAVPSSDVAAVCRLPEFGPHAPPILSVAGDQQAALFGQGCFEPGQVKNTYGTGCFLLMNTGNEAIKSEHGLLTTIAASGADHVEYALEGSVFVAGAVVQWLRDEMRMVKTASQTEEYASDVFDTAGVYLVPAFAGMGAPYWNQYARGTVVGITRGCKKEHFIRAALESIAYQSSDLIRAMEEDAGISLNDIKVDGGASANNFLMKFQANITDRAVRRPKCIETTAMGAAFLAGLSVGFWKDREELTHIWELGRVFIPEMDETERAMLLKGWKKAVKCALVWAED